MALVSYQLGPLAISMALVSYQPGPLAISMALDSYQPGPLAISMALVSYQPGHSSMFTCGGVCHTQACLPVVVCAILKHVYLWWYVPPLKHVNLW